MQVDQTTIKNTKKVNQFSKSPQTINTNIAGPQQANVKVPVFTGSLKTKTKVTPVFNCKTG